MRQTGFETATDVSPFLNRFILSARSQTGIAPLPFAHCFGCFRVPDLKGCIILFLLRLVSGDISGLNI